MHLYEPACNLIKIMTRYRFFISLCFLFFSVSAIALTPNAQATRRLGLGLRVRRFIGAPCRRF